MRSAHLSHDPHRAEEDAEVAEERPLADVAGLERDDFLEVGDLVAAVDLPWPRDTRLHVEPRVMVLLVQGDLGGQRWTRAHQRHLATQYIDQLWQLIQAGAPQEPTEPGHPGIVPDLEQARVAVHAAGQQLIALLLRAVDHGPELDDPEQPPAPPHPLLREEHRPVRLELDQRRQQGEQRAQYDQPDDRARHVHRSLDGELPALEAGRGQLDQRLSPTPY